MFFQHQFFADYYDRLEGLFKTMRNSVEDLPMEAINWVPGEDMNSMAVLVAHTCGSTLYWVGSFPSNEDSTRVRDDEFLFRGKSVDELLTMLDDTLAMCKSYLETYTLETIESESFNKDRGSSYFHSWSLIHAITHAAVHVGDTEITHQLWVHRQR